MRDFPKAFESYWANANTFLALRYAPAYQAAAIKNLAYRAWLNGREYQRGKK